MDASAILFWLAVGIVWIAWKTTNGETFDKVMNSIIFLAITAVVLGGCYGIIKAVKWAWYN